MNPHDEDHGKTGQVVILGQNYWGAGDTIEKAKAKFRYLGGQLSRGYLVLTFDAETEFFGVDDYGRYHYKGNAPVQEPHPERKVRS